MTIITLEISPELEQQLREAAAKQGLDPDRYIVNALTDRLHPVSSQPSHLSQTESELLQQINLGLPQATWDTYHELIAKRRAETLHPEEQQTLIEISDRLEQANAHRIQCLIELASLRNISLEALMQQLGIEPPSYA
jgi:iron-sulfur cluster repair protein YtfE (RIC family)